MIWLGTARIEVVTLFKYLLAGFLVIPFVRISIRRGLSTLTRCALVLAWRTAGTLGVP